MRAMHSRNANARVATTKACDVEVDSFAVMIVDNAVSGYTSY